jgi:tetratricopeptide (TPR) repeat protein
MATLLVTRRRQYAQGLALIDRAAALRPDDAGIWYAVGWCYEFAAHEIRRRAAAADLDVPALYARAADAFRRCLALHPDGKLADDAADLLDHVDNELRSL